MMELRRTELLGRTEAETAQELGSPQLHHLAGLRDDVAAEICQPSPPGVLVRCFLVPRGVPVQH